jgi:hypothetical protein
MSVEFNFVSNNNRKKFTRLSKKWNKIYSKFLHDVYKLKTEAGGEEVLNIQVSEKSIFRLTLVLKDE